jgi:hypothetical protein
MSTKLNNCPKCEKIFETVKGLKIHISKCKESEKILYKCEICNSNFHEERYLKSHLKTKHHLAKQEKYESEKKIKEERELQEEKRQLTQTQAQPQIINNYITNNNTYTTNNTNNSSSTHTIINNTLNYNYKTFTLEAAKQEFSNFSLDKMYIDENDICNSTIDKLSKYIFYADKSRGKLAFYDDINGDKVKVKDKGGILIAEKVYDVLTPLFENVLNTLNRTKDPRHFLPGDYIQIKSIQDLQKELAHYVLSQNPISKAKYGKSLLKKLYKFQPKTYIEKFKTLTRFQMQLAWVLTEKNFSNLFYEFEALGLLIKERITFDVMNPNYIQIKDDKDKPTELNPDEFFQFLCYVLKDTVTQDLSEVWNECSKLNDLEKVKNWNLNQNIILQKLPEEELKRYSGNLFFNMTLR